MKTATLRALTRLATTSAGLALCVTALAQRPTPSAGRPCNPGNCVLTVTVSNCQAEGGISVDPDTVVVSSARNMRWEIVPKNSGFVFAANGIEFDPPNAQFQPRNNPQPDRWHIHNTKTSNGDFYYFVNIKRADGTPCRRHDPFVRNVN